MEVNFSLNGKEFKINPLTVPLDTTLNSFIRDHAKLSGTKFMCLEGGCGVCTVTLRGIHPVTKEFRTWAVNSCLQFIYSCNGLEIITVEGLGNSKTGMHPIQKRLADYNGTQCGFCSCGMVMNMFALLESKNGEISMDEVENSFGGNICRCTGYRPILDAFKSLAIDMCSDIEDLNGMKCGISSTGSSLARSLKEQFLSSYKLTFTDGREWYRVQSVKEITEILHKIRDKPYILVDGNTGHGVYRRSPDLKVFIDISAVAQLKTHRKHIDSLEIGANITLSETMQIFTKIANEDRNFSYLHELVKHIDKVAHVAVRNNGTLAGNLMLKHQHNEFESDLFLIFDAVNAVLTISGQRFEPNLRFYDNLRWNRFSNKLVRVANFLEYDMNKKIILKIKFPAYNPDQFVFRSYKVIKRKQNSHAIVNAAFLLELNPRKSSVVSSRICYGGINPHFTHAGETEKFLIGKYPFDNSTLQSILHKLNDEINPDWRLPDESPEYRKNLAISLFYKFILNIVPDSVVTAKFKSGGKVLKREISSGIQVFDTNENKWPLTKPIKKIEADIQCTGEAKYVNDFPPLPGEVHGAFVTATKVHGIIASINAAKALEISGVVGFFSAKDIPGKNNFTPLNVIQVREEEEILCSSKVLYYDQPVGIILASTNEIANRAAKLVEIFYENSSDATKVLTSISDVVTYAPETIETLREFNKTATETGKIGVHNVKGNYHIGSQYHYTMEPQSAVVIPNENVIEVHSSSQWIDITQIAVADALNIPESSVDVTIRRVGGGYGAKISRSVQIACAAAIAARLLNRPVRFIMNIETNMSVIGKRYAVFNEYDVDFDENGMIQNLTVNYIEDAGCSKNEPDHIFTTPAIQNCYESKYFNIIARNAYTNKPSSTWCRAPGTTAGFAIIENIMERLARIVKKDPLEVRLNNVPEDSPMKQYLPDFAESVEYEKRKKIINEFNDSNRWTKKGIAIVPLKTKLDFDGISYALVSIYHGDGSVAISIGGIELGQGINTKVAQVVASIFDISLEKISVKASNSLTAPNNTVTAGGFASDSSCFAVRRACEILQSRLDEIRKDNPSAEWPEFVELAHKKNIDLSTNYMFKPDDDTSYDVWGVSCAEIEVDVLTGNVQILRMDILEDVGESISPGIDVGQIEGSIIMGLGFWLNEELIYDDETGRLTNNRTWNYKPPGFQDIPVDFRVTFFRNAKNPAGVVRSKTTGEAALAMSYVAVCALRHALDSARRDSNSENDEFYQLTSPSTPEYVFLQSLNEFTQFLIQ